MKNDDVALIHNILSGDDKAFGILVEKYQKGIHALAWRKIGDFQIAEEIAQDAFLQAYKKLATLKKPDQFAGWLYVITSRLCADWHRRKKPIMQSIEDTNKKVLDKNAYEEYLAKQREVAAAEQRQELVKRLLGKLPESERTVVTLHYIGEMTSDAISRLLGVSINTIKSRLRRARKRLKEEEPMIRETLNNVQLQTNFTEKVMEKIANIKPTPSPNSKPLLPWAAVCSAAVLIICLLGASTRYQTRFNKPYDLESESEATIELVDASVIFDYQSKPDNKRKIGNAIAFGVDNLLGKEHNDLMLAAEAQEILPEDNTQANNWIQVQGPESAEINDLFVSSKGTLFAVSSTGVYRIADDNSGWKHMESSKSLIGYYKMPIAEWEENLYITTYRGIYGSNDDGVNWNFVSNLPKGATVELLINQDGFFLANDNGVFHSVGPGQPWKQLNSGLENKKITSMSTIGNTLFVGTEDGLYRLKAQTWHRLNEDNIKSEVTTIEVSKNKLYVATVDNDKFNLITIGVIKGMLTRTSMNWKIFRSDDLGDSWENITPKSSNPLERVFDLNMLVSGETVFVIGMKTFRSRDGGKSWTNLGRVKDADGYSDSPMIALNDNTFYKQGRYKINRSIDGGESWHKFMKGIIGSDIHDLASYNNKLYAKTPDTIVYSTDGGETWIPVQIDSGKGSDHYPSEFTVVDDAFFALARDSVGNVRICSLSSDGTDLKPIPGLPTIASKRQNTPRIIALENSNNTFYLVSNGRLFKATMGATEWTDTEFDFEKSNTNYGVRIAVSDKNIYVGRRDTHLIQSVDGGKNWKDITSDLPIQFNFFRDITILESYVYVATEKGVISSDSGEEWHVIMDSEGRNVGIDMFFVEGKNIYGVANKGVYRLEKQEVWKLITPALPHAMYYFIRQFINHDNKFYIVTREKGILKIPIGE